MTVGRRASAGQWPAALMAVALMAAVIPATSAVAIPARAKMSPTVKGALRSLPAHRAMSVIVTMGDQADLSTRRGLSSDDRVRRTVSRLRREARRTQASIRRVLRRAPAGAVRRVTPLWVINGLVVKADERTIRAVARRPDVASVSGNVAAVVPAESPAVASVLTEPNITLTGAPALWAQGVTGNGAVVASLDTGVDSAHPDLSAGWRGGSNSWFDPYGQHPTTPTDVSGHGTQAMGVIVGGDAHGTSIGMAPDAEWIAAKIFRDDGSATTAGIHQGFQWVLDPDGDPATADAPDVVNNSWSLSSPGCDLTFQPDLQALKAAGIPAVFAAANFGPIPGTGSSPANNPEAVAVGAVDNSDEIATDSSRGPSSCGEPSTTYPELVAPGVGITTSDLFGGWTSVTGTSMSAPHVSGALALLLAIRPDQTPAQQVMALESSAVDLGAVGPDNDYGFGRLDATAAYAALPPPPNPTPPSEPSAAAGDFAITATPSKSRVRPGGKGSFKIEVSTGSGFSDPVAVSALTPRGGPSASLKRTTLYPGQQTMLRLKTRSVTRRGVYPVSVSGMSRGIVHLVRVKLKVRGLPR